MSMCRVISCVVGRGCFLWPVCSLGKTLLALSCFIPYSKAKFPCYFMCFLTSLSMTICATYISYLSLTFKHTHIMTWEGIIYIKLMQICHIFIWLKYFGDLMQRTDSGKNPDLGKIEGKRRREGQRMRWLDGIIDWMDIIWANSRSWWWTRKPGMLQSMGSQRVGQDQVTELNCSSSCFAICFYTTYQFGGSTKRMQRD